MQLTQEYEAGGGADAPAERIVTVDCDNAPHAKKQRWNRHEGNE